MSDPQCQSNYCIYSLFDASLWRAKISIGHFLPSYHQIPCWSTYLHGSEWNMFANIDPKGTHVPLVRKMLTPVLGGIWTKWLHNGILTCMDGGVYFLVKAFHKTTFNTIGEQEGRSKIFCSELEEIFGEGRYMISALLSLFCSLK